MADDADRATELQDMEREGALQRRVLSSPAATGECLWCGEELEGRRWCDAKCRDDWEKGR